MLFAYLILLIISIILGLTNYLDPNETDSTPNWKIFFAITFICRFIQGASDAMLITCTNSIIAITFMEEKMVYMGYIESAISFGLIFGPLMGSFIYTWLGYSFCFYFVSFVFSLTFISCFFIMPGTIDF